MVSVSIDRNLGRRRISPLIYGINDYVFEKMRARGEDIAGFMNEIALPLRRWGGNLASRYNYQNDITNHGRDWYFCNSLLTNGTQPPADSTVNRWIEANQLAGADSLVLMPTSGYVANGDADAWGFSVAKYGAQDATGKDDGRPDAGNGISGGVLITDNDPLDTSVRIGPAFVQDWVGYLVARYGKAAAGGVRFYSLDNEPDIWWDTQRDIRPVAPNYDEMCADAYAYAAAIKAADPNAAVIGPSLGSLTDFFFSAKSNQERALWPDLDRQAHGGLQFVAWYLQQMSAYEQANGVRILDYLDLHYYPQADGVYGNGGAGEAGDAATQQRRLDATGGLWDSGYLDPTPWIQADGETNGYVKLIPRMRDWADQYYPGTKIALSEYGWSALDDINGALAQADVLGILGREGVDMAALFAEEFGSGEPGAFAFRMYRNYDGAGSRFGETGVRALSSDPGQVAVYAAECAGDGALTVIAVNKTQAPADASFTISNFAGGPQAAVYQYGPANLAAIVRLPDLPLPAAWMPFDVTLPANSITLLELPA